MKILIVGGTRNMGYLLVHDLREHNHEVTVINRGISRDDLPADVERLRADRTDAVQLQKALRGRTFDAIVDMTLYKAEEAESAVETFGDKTAHYVFISSGQVYLVREGVERPFKESSYSGMLMPPPKPDTYSYIEWLYGMDKRRAEDILHAAFDQSGFPVTTLRLPMVNSERDHFKRLYNYVLRLQDGNPILVPATPNFLLRHVYARDATRAIVRILENGLGHGRAYNISQEETLTLDGFLQILGEIIGVEPDIRRVPRELLEANGFLPDCSPFSERWMSELDNTLSKTELGVTYTPLRAYLQTSWRTSRRTRPPRRAAIAAAPRNCCCSAARRQVTDDLCSHGLRVNDALIEQAAHHIAARQHHLGRQQTRHLVHDGILFGWQHAAEGCRRPGVRPGENGFDSQPLDDNACLVFGVRSSTHRVNQKTAARHSSLIDEKPALKYGLAASTQASVRKALRR
ncbi:MAG: NAD-dependent epimerase/dehydratase family protein [Blastochloris sp.]|nr:NAD-dependent epimerase/dehydratase family protein [Blastochloris sp.]